MEPKGTLLDFGQTQRAHPKGTLGAPKGTLGAPKGTVPFGKGLARTLALISLLECAWTCPVYQQSSLFGIMMSVRKWSFSNSGSLRLQLQYHAWWPYLLLLRLLLRLWDLGVTEEVHRQISKQIDQGSSTIKFLPSHFCPQWHFVTIVSQSQILAFCVGVWLCSSTWWWASDGTMLRYRGVRTMPYKLIQFCGEVTALEIQKVVQPRLSNASHKS